MPGMPFLTPSDPFVMNQPQAATVGPGLASGSTSNWTFFAWLVLIGVVLPLVVLGGLRAGGFQFVYKRRG